MLPTTRKMVRSPANGCLAVLFVWSAGSVQADDAAGGQPAEQLALRPYVEHEGQVQPAAGRGRPAATLAIDPAAVMQAAYTDTDAAEVATRQEVESADQPEILWPGFLYGLSGFEDFAHPVSSPIYNHDPFIDTRLNVLYVWHKFPDGCDIKGGDLQVWALQLYVALTERLQLTATCDGYSRLRARALQPDEGWNDLMAGLKYNLLADVDRQFLLSTGLSWRLSNGHARTLHGGVDELNPYVTAAKGFGKCHVIGTVGGRLAMDHNMGNHILYESLHIDYELFENFYPLIEFNGLQYLRNADRLPLGVGGLDYANIGSNDVRGNSTFWGEVGFRWKVVDHLELGATYGFPMMDPDNDIFDHRVTVSVIVGL